MLSKLSLLLCCTALIAAAPPVTAFRHKHQITMYSAQWCGPCHKAERYLRCLGLPFDHQDVDKDRGADKRYKALNGWSLPLLIVDGVRMDGYQEKRLIDLLAEGESQGARERLLACLQR